MEELKSKLITLIDKADEKLIRLMLAIGEEYSKEDQPLVESEPLYRLVYTSARMPRCTDEDIEQILEISRENNAKQNITGILIHTKDRFLQVLEGEERKVKALYEKINHDNRHGGSVMRFCEPVTKRYFSDWNMAGKRIDENKVRFHTSISDQKMAYYKSMMDGDLSSYKDEGMRVLKTFLMVS
ncbi:BLUF domain-containing protein [Ekhidna sp.]|uniref:BLUF domain-containing protein n=1 Tax=Ekhidna sp. TaxID=2608089 RepID=UPI003CCC3880